MCLLLKEWKRLVIQDGIMYRRILDCQRGVVEQLVLPEKLRELVKTALHDDSGHLGFERTDGKSADGKREVSLATDVPGDQGMV